MKPRLLLYLALLAYASSSAYAAGHISLKAYTKDLVYTFEVYAGETEKWDPNVQPAPPLAPGKAAAIAKAFIAKVPLDENMKDWSIDTIALKSLDWEKHWIYDVSFSANPKANVWNGPVPTFHVPVKMDGTIPEPVIGKAN